MSVADAYRWLEDGDSPEVRAWTAAQARYARGVLDGLRGRAALRERLRALFSIGSVAPPAVHGSRYFYERRRGGEEQPILYVRSGLRGEERVLLDPAGASADAASALDWYYPSPDGSLLAYGTSDGGSEMSTLRVRVVDGGADLEDVIPQTRACSLAWLPDGSGFYYTRYPEPGAVAAGEESYGRHVFLHVLGTAWRADARVFGEGRASEDWPNVLLSPAGRYLVVSVSRGWTATDVYLQDRFSGRDFVTVLEGEDCLAAALPRDDRLYLLTNRGAPRYRLVAADPARPGPASWHDLVPESEDVIEAFEAPGPCLVVQRLRDAASRLSLHGLDGRLLCDVPLPLTGSVEGLSGEWNGSEAFFGFSSYAFPPAVYRVALPSGETTLWARAEAALDPDAFRVRLARCASKDGTPVSMFLVDRADRADDGRGPAVLTGYGGFGVSLTPAFGRSLLAFLEDGGLYAVAHLRGGGERGEDWHRAGMLEHKQNVFDDCIAAAEHLVANGHAAPDRLAVLGGSNGGLLAGAVLTQRPELFRAAVCQVPLLDMLRYQRFRIARLWVAEYGSADDERAFRWLLRYSPYHRVVDGTAYPAVLLATGEADSRVDPLHARKMAARLQAATCSGRPVLLRVESRAGHGQGKPLSKALEEWTDVWSFLFSELGMFQ